MELPVISLITPRDVGRIRLEFNIFRQSATSAECRLLVDFFSDEEDTFFYILVYYCHYYNLSVEEYIGSLLNQDMQKKAQMLNGEIFHFDQIYPIFRCVSEVFVKNRWLMDLSRSFPLVNNDAQLDRYEAFLNRYLLTPLTKSPLPGGDDLVACLANAMCAVKDLSFRR